MAQLTNDKPRTYKIDPVEYGTQPADLNAIIFMGSMVGLNPATSFARQLVAGDAFLGIADERADSMPPRPGVPAPAVGVECRIHGVLVVPPAAVAGASSATPAGTAVYASDGDTLTLTSAGNTKVGTVRNNLPNVGLIEVEFFAVGN